MADNKIPDQNAETALLDLFDAIFPPESRQIEEIDHGTHIITTYMSDPPIPSPFPVDYDDLVNDRFSNPSSSNRKA